ncbi:hypothetical protein ACIA8G_27220 [Lentzea sp. NPDC051213]|uniref:hypothetical protein n=1 Tax=Lentzea sp. NPDC051213 TaxID=3364126 RepID=UPI0037A2C97C
MPEGLVSVEGNHVRFSEAVSRIADSLSPLGPAGRCVAESYALVTEMSRINLEKARVADDKEVKLAVLDQRRRESTSTLRQLQKELGNAGKSASALRECMVNMQRETVKPGLALAERRAYIDLTGHFTTMLVQHHSDLTGGVADVIDKVLNGSGAAALARASGRRRR